MTHTLYRNEQVFFRVVGVCQDVLHAFLGVLGDVPYEARKRKGKNDFVLSIKLSTPAVCEAIQRALLQCPLEAPYGSYISLVTESDSDGVHLEPFICDFVHKVGGDLDFSFTIV